MDPLALVDELAAIGDRRAGSDAERRAARLLALRLRAGGRRGTRIRTTWVRPHWAPLHALLTGVAVAGSLVSVAFPVTGLALCAAALVLLLVDLSGRIPPLLRRVTFERATQNVVAPDPRGDLDARVRLVLTAATDLPRPLWLADRGARLRARLGGRLPSLHGLLVAALVLLVACTAARVAVEDPPGALGALQLVPTVVVLAIGALLLERATAAPAGPGASADASAAAAVLQLAEALDRLPPRRLAVDVVLAGAGHDEALGFRRWLDAARAAGARAEGVAVLHVGPCGCGAPVWWTAEGRTLPRALHPQLLDVAARAAAADPALGARPVCTPQLTAARIARGRGWPALSIGALPADCALPDAGTPADTTDRVDAATIDATVAFALSIVALLDAELDALPVAQRPPGAPPSPA